MCLMLTWFVLINSLAKFVSPKSAFQVLLKPTYFQKKINDLEVICKPKYPKLSELR